MGCRVGVLEGKELLLYSFPPPHPFTNDRTQLFWDELHRKKLPVKLLPPQKADKELIGLFTQPST